MINRNELAKSITEREGLKVQVNIAQVKEVLRIALEELSGFNDDEIIQLLNKIRKGYFKRNVWV